MYGLVAVKYMTYNTNRKTDIKSHFEYQKVHFNKEFNILLKYQKNEIKATDSMKKINRFT